MDKNKEETKTTQKQILGSIELSTYRYYSQFINETLFMITGSLLMNPFDRAKTILQSKVILNQLGFRIESGAGHIVSSTRKMAQ